MISKWGAKWRQAIKDHYLYMVNIQTHGAVMAHHDNYLDLDPNYRDVFGQPFAGGQPLNTQFGIIYSTNITPVPWVTKISRVLVFKQTKRRGHEFERGHCRRSR
ncbi:MAG: hypothetical protein V2B19_29040 [Pseudomonadota bacterium]